MKFKLLFVPFFIALTITGCSGVKLQDYPAESCTKLPGEKTITTIKEKCLLCHKGDFASKELICARKNMITEAVKSGRMPKFKKLKDDQLGIILKWEE